MSDCPSLRPPVRMEKFGSHSTDLQEIGYLSIFRKFVREVQTSSKSDKNNGYFTRRPIYIYDHISLNSSCNVKSLGQNL
jgi:hypothetical protein